MTGGTTTWFDEAHFQLHLSALWACWETASRASDQAAVRTDFDAYRRHEWFPGIADFAEQLVSRPCLDGPDWVANALQLADAVWTAFWKVDWFSLERLPTITADDFRREFRQSVEAVLKKTGDDCASSPETLPATFVVPPDCPIRDRQRLVAAWAAQSQMRAAWLKQRLILTQQKEPNGSAIAHVTSPQTAMMRENCIALQSSAKRRLQLIRPFYIRWMRDPDEPQFLEEVVEILGAFAERLEDGRNIDSVVRANAAATHPTWHPPLDEVVERTWQEAGPNWPPQALLDLADDLSLDAIEFCQFITSSPDSQAGSLASFIGPGEGFESDWTRLRQTDVARLLLIRRVVQFLGKSKEPSVETWKVVSSWSNRLLDDTEVELHLVSDVQSLRDRSWVTDELSLSAMNEYVRQPALFVKFKASSGLWRTAIVVRPSGLAQFARLLEQITRIGTNRKLNVSEWKRLVDRFHGSAKDQPQRHASLAHWWREANRNEQTLLWLLLQQLQLMRMICPDVESCAVQFLAALDANGFKIGADPGKTTKEQHELLAEGCRWIFLHLDSRAKRDGATDGCPGLSLLGPDDVWLAPAVHFRLRPPKTSDSLLPLTQIVYELLVSSDAAVVEQWQAHYDKFASALAASEPKLAVQPGLTLLTLCFRETAGRPDADTPTVLLRRFCYAVYRCLCDLAQATVIPKLLNEKLESPRWQQMSEIPTSVTPEWIPSESPAGTILRVDAFTDGSEPVIWQISCGRLDPKSFVDWLKLPSCPHFEGIEDQQIRQQLTLLRRDAKHALFSGRPVEKALQPQCDALGRLFAENEHGIDWFHNLVTAASRDQNSTAAIWFRLLLQLGIPCFPLLSLESGRATWPIDEPLKPDLGVEFSTETPAGTALDVSQYAVRASLAKAKISLGSPQPFSDAERQFRELWIKNQDWLSENTTYRGKLETSLKRPTCLRLLSRPLDSVDKLMSPLLQTMLKASHRIKVLEDLTENQRQARLDTLDNLLLFLRTWCQSLSVDIMPRAWRFQSPIFLDDLEPELREKCAASFSTQAANVVELNQFGVQVHSAAYAATSIPCELSVSVGKEPAALAPLMQLLPANGTDTSAELRQRLTRLAEYALNYGRDSAEWQDEGERLFDAYYGHSDNKDRPSATQNEIAQYLRKLLEEDFRLKIKMPSNQDIQDKEWVEFSGGPNGKRVLRVLSPALLTDNNLVRCKAKILTD